MTIAGIATLLIVVLFALHGMKKGLVRMAAGLLSIVVAAFLVRLLLPYVTQAIRSTPAYDYVTAQCEKILNEEVIRSAAQSLLPKQGTAEGGAPDREQIKALLDQNGMDSSVVDMMSDSELAEYVSAYIGAAGAEAGQVAADTLDTLTKVEQTELIRKLPIPDFLQRLMINFNNSEGYKKLGVTDFAGYLVRFIANIIMNAAAFLVTMLLTWIIVRGILAALDLSSRLPVIGMANRVGGLIAGALEGMFFVWLVFLVISLLSGTRIGLTLQNMISDSFVLQPLYDSNVFLKIVSDTMNSIL